MLEDLNKENIELTDKELDSVNGGSRLNLHDHQNDQRRPELGSAPAILKYTITTCPGCRRYQQMAVYGDGVIKCDCGKSWTAFV